MSSPPKPARAGVPGPDFLRRSLLGNTLLVVGAITVAAATLFILITLAITRAQFETQANDSLEELIDSMGSMASIACFTRDETLARETAQAFIKNSDVMRVTISAYGKPLASAARIEAPLAAEADARVLSRQINSPFEDQEVIGSLTLEPNWPEIERQVTKTVRRLAIMMSALVVGVLGVMAAVFTVLVIRPVKTISDHLHALDPAGGQVLGTSARHEKNELGRLVKDINALVARFRSSLEREHELHLQQVINERTRLSAAVFEDSQEGIVVTDRDNRIVTVNRAFTHITGYTEAEVVGANPAILASGRQDKDFYRRMWHSINTLGYWKGELWNRCKNGEIKPKWFSISAVHDEAGEIANYVAIFSDITERKLAEERIEFLAHHDALTKLPNRVLTRDRFAHAVALAQREKNGVAVLYVDLDNFKYVNDSFGHLAGDHLLLVAVERLQQHIRESDTISRQGGDEFLIILPGIDDPAVAERIAGQILTTLSQPFDIEGHAIGISASVGITLYPQHGADFDTLLKNADAAMYAAKSAGKSAYRVFSEDMNVDALDKLELKAELRLALNRREFHLVFQPQINIATQQMVGAEALIRWHNPQRGVVAPGLFIPLAEESGMIGEIGDWVVGEACRLGKQWFDAGIEPFAIAVNVSSQQFNHGAIFNTVERTLAQTGFPASFLELEFTESGLLSDVEHSLATIEQLRGLGIKLSIDDFGTGYSSLSYLKQLKVEKLKIDQSFVRDIGANPEGLEIIRAVIQLGKTLQLKVIAEGVETQEQLDTLRALECNEAQGYFISRPLTADALVEFVEDQVATI